VNTEQRLIADYSFCKEDFAEFGYKLCPLLRTVAALNPEATKKEFVAAMVQCGVRKETAAIQWATVRKQSPEYFN
jgi:hypothetical protein